MTATTGDRKGKVVEADGDGGESLGRGDALSLTLLQEPTAAQLERVALRELPHTSSAAFAAIDLLTGSSDNDINDINRRQDEHVLQRRGRWCSPPALMDGRRRRHRRGAACGASGGTQQKYNRSCCSSWRLPFVLSAIASIDPTELHQPTQFSLQIDPDPARELAAFSSLGTGKRFVAHQLKPRPPFQFH